MLPGKARSPPPSFSLVILMGNFSLSPSLSSYGPLGDDAALGILEQKAQAIVESIRVHPSFLVQARSSLAIVEMLNVSDRLWPRG